MLNWYRNPITRTGRGCFEIAEPSLTALFDCRFIEHSVIELRLARRAGSGCKARVCLSGRRCVWVKRLFSRIAERRNIRYTIAFSSKWQQRVLQQGCKSSFCVEFADIGLHISASREHLKDRLARISEAS
ncbi:hypothetical protein CI238_00203 [Colletotrichum incanum]|uniref:Uncharacterized protein n=1 Tax=Colletotrichum incanum TaxID=1573173 RepID=A0A166QZL9_COLIC|nr:hypothetical protein CI238_00203 [Colletotrichum incanum]